MQKLFSAVAHCHANGVIHRNINPEAILITRTGDVKLIDFSLSTKKTKKSTHTEIVGSVTYMAPEMIKSEEYNEKVDCWALGVLLYLLVSGYLPFDGEKASEITSKIVSCKYTMDQEEFVYVSANCKDLIKHLLVINPNRRLSAAEALNHAFFKTQTNKEEKVILSDDALKRFVEFKGVSQLKKTALNILI